MRLMNLKKIILSFVILTALVSNSNQINSSFYPDLISYDAPMTGVQILILIENDFNLPEYFDAISRFDLYGCNVTIAGPRETIISGSHSISVDILFAEVNVANFDCIYVPGGVSAEELCLIPDCLTLLQTANTQGICLAAVCAGPLVFAAADIVNGRNVTGNILIKDELIAAGGIFIDGGQCVRDNNLLTADGPYLLDLLIEITKVLGFYESDPPEIISVDYQITSSDSSFNCYLEAHITDEFGVGFVQAQFYKYDNGEDEKTFFTSAQLLDPDQDNIFNKNITGFSIGRYVIELTVIDIHTNEFTNSSILEFTISDTNVSGFRLLFIIPCLIFSGTLLLIVRQKNSKRA